MIGDAGEEPPEPPEPLDPYLRPISISGGTLIGGAGNNTLRDQSDDTYARLNRTPHSGAFTATFETRTLGYTPIQATLHVRARSLEPVPNFYYVVWLMSGYAGFGVLPYTNPAWGGGLPLTSQTGTNWHVMSSNWRDDYPEPGYVVPSAGAVAAGGLTVSFDAAASVASPGEVGTTFQIDIADVWLDLRT